METKVLKKEMIEDLIHQAFEAQTRAYVPYSQFAVELHFFPEEAEYTRDVILRMHPTRRLTVRNEPHFLRQCLKVSQNLMPLPLWEIKSLYQREKGTIVHHVVYADR